MTTITRFEEIEAWKKSRVLINLIYDFTKSPVFKTDFCLVTQVRKTAISISSNIAEGFARRTDNEFINFLSISHGSVAELQSQLYIALDQAYITKQEFKNAYDLAEEVSKLTQGFINHLRNNNLGGRKSPES